MSLDARLGLQQRVLPAYRVPFFDALAGACSGGLSIFAGQPRPEESIEAGRGPQVARHAAAHNIHLLRGPLYLCYQAGLLQWLEAWQPDALILEANPRYLAQGSAQRWMQARKRPVLGWGLGAPAAAGALSGLRKTVRRALLGGFDALLAYSQTGAEQYRALGFPAERVFVAANAAAPRPTWPLPARPPAFDAPPRLLFVGRLQARKRVDLLLHACAQLHQILPPEKRPSLWVVGDGPARAELEALAREVFPLAQFVGARHGAELEPYYTAADLFVLPGTGGLAVQQAMAYGLPVAVAEADGTQADLVRPQNGWLLPPGDLPRLTETLAEALGDTPRLRQMGQASYDLVYNEINLEKMVEVFCQAVQSVR